MKKLLFILLALLPCLQSFADCSDCEVPLTVRFKTEQLTQINGSLVLSLDVKRKNISIDIDSIYYLLPPAFSLQGSTLDTGAYSGDTLEAHTLSLTYNSSALPYYLQEVRQYIVHNNGKTEASFVYIYFTPWNTIEVWNENELPADDRKWLTPNNITNPERIYINPLNLPPSPDTSKPVFWRRIEGLAYKVPVNLDSAEIASDTSGLGKMSFGFNADVTGRLIYQYANDLGLIVPIPLAGVKVEVIKETTLGVNVTLAEGVTEDDGTFDLIYSHMPLINFTGNIDVFVRFTFEGDNVTVNYNSLAFGLDKTYDCQTGQWNHSSNGSAHQQFNLGNIATLDMHRGHVYHWANRAVTFAREELADLNLNWGHLLVNIPQNLDGDKCYFARGFDMPAEGKLKLVAQRCITNERTTYHEVGHYVQYAIQNRQFHPDEDAAGSHTIWNNNKHPNQTIQEGFATGFACMVDSRYFTDDMEAEIYNGWDFHEAGTAILPNTHPFTAEFIFSKTLLDLWDNVSDLRSFGIPTIPISDDIINDFGNDNVSLSFRQICMPFYLKRSSVSDLIQDVGEYFSYLTLVTNNCDVRRGIKQIADMNFVNTTGFIGTGPLFQISSDEIAIPQIITHQDDKLTRNSVGDLVAGIVEEYPYPYNVDINAIPAGRTYNMVDYPAPLKLLWPKKFIGDNLLVSGSNTALTFNNNTTAGWDHLSPYNTLPPSGSRVEVDVCADNLRITNGGTMEIGSADEFAHATVRVLGGSTLTLGDNSAQTPNPTTVRLVINNNSTLIIEPGATLEVFPNMEIILNGDNAVLDIKGELLLRENTDFTFIGGTQGSGFVSFTAPSNNGRNVRGFPGSRISLIGSGKNDLVLRVAGGALFDGMIGNYIESFQLKNARAELVSTDSRIYLESCEVDINNCHIDNAGLGLNFEGQSIADPNDPNMPPQRISIVNIRNIDIECTGTAERGIGAYMNGNNRTGVVLRNINISQCKTGITSFNHFLKIRRGTGVHDYSHIINTREDSEIGWEAYMVTGQCEFSQSQVSEYRLNGIRFLSTNKSLFDIKNARIENNGNGVHIDNAQLFTKCSYITNNKKTRLITNDPDYQIGIYGYDADIWLEHSNSDISENLHAIKLDGTNGSKLFIASGHNNFASPASGGVCIVGNWAASGPQPPAEDNFWGTGNLVTPNPPGSPFDINPSAYSLTNPNITPKGPSLSSWDQDCAAIVGEEYSGPQMVVQVIPNFIGKKVTKANDPYLLNAYNSALTKFEESKFFDAFDEFNNLLQVNAMYDTANRELLLSSYHVMMQSLSRGIEKYEINIFPDSSVTSAYVLNNLFKVQDSLAARIQDDKSLQYNIKLDKANIYRRSYKFSKSLSIINELINDTNYIDPKDYLIQIKCFTEAEKMVFDKEVPHSEFYKLVEVCAALKDSSKTILRKRNISRNVSFENNKKSVSKLTLSPNPAQDKLSAEITNVIEGFADVQVTGISGNIMLEMNNIRLIDGVNKLLFDVSQIKSGVYIMNIRTKERIFREKFVIVR